MKFDHINVCAPLALLEREKQFYCDLFNLTEGFRPQFTRAGFWLYSGEHALIHLTESDQHSATGTTGYLDHLAFELTGLEVFVQRLEHLGIPFTTDFLPELPMTQLFFTSPAGIGLEVNFKNESLN